MKKTKKKKKKNRKKNFNWCLMQLDDVKTKMWDVLMMCKDQVQCSSL